MNEDAVRILIYFLFALAVVGAYFLFIRPDIAFQFPFGWDSAAHFVAMAGPHIPLITGVYALSHFLGTPYPYLYPPLPWYIFECFRFFGLSTYWSYFGVQMLAVFLLVFSLLLVISTRREFALSIPFVLVSLLYVSKVFPRFDFGIHAVYNGLISQTYAAGFFIILIYVLYKIRKEKKAQIVVPLLLALIAISHVQEFFLGALLLLFLRGWRAVRDIVLALFLVTPFLVPMVTLVHQYHTEVFAIGRIFQNFINRPDWFFIVVFTLSFLAVLTYDPFSLKVPKRDPLFQVIFIAATVLLLFSLGSIGIIRVPHLYRLDFMLVLSLCFLSGFFAYNLYVKSTRTLRVIFVFTFIVLFAALGIYTGSTIGEVYRERTSALYNSIQYLQDICGLRDEIKNARVLIVFDPELFPATPHFPWAYATYYLSTPTLHGLYAEATPMATFYFLVEQMLADPIRVFVWGRKLPPGVPVGRYSVKPSTYWQNVLKYAGVNVFCVYIARLEGNTLYLDSFANGNRIELTGYIVNDEKNTVLCSGDVCCVRLNISPNIERVVVVPTYNSTLFSIENDYPEYIASALDGAPVFKAYCLSAPQCAELNEITLGGYGYFVHNYNIDNGRKTISVRGAPPRAFVILPVQYVPWMYSKQTGLFCHSTTPYFPGCFSGDGNLDIAFDSTPAIVGLLVFFIGVFMLLM